MEPTKTLMPLDRWLQAVKANDTTILLLAGKDKIIVYDGLRNFLKPLFKEGQWSLASFEDDDLLT